MTTGENPRSSGTGASPVQTLAERSAAVDETVLAAAGELLFPALPQGLALMAVGGYGRRHLFPHSDVDLLLLAESERQARGAREAISAFLQRLWDSGLRVSHSVRTPAECAELHDQNIELNVSLLDQRFLGGDRALYAEMAERLPRFLRAQREELVRHLVRLARERRAKFHDTFYHLEPNIKETPGGLRDLQLVCWLEELREQAAHSEIPAELLPAWEFLARVRMELHAGSGRDQNLLTFDAQDALAEREGAVDTASWMREYFRHARSIDRAARRAMDNAEAQSSSLFSQFRDWRARLSNADFTVSRERVQLRSPQRLDADPDLALRLFEFLARHGVPASPEAEDRVAARLPRLAAAFAEPRPLWPPLREILSLPHAALALRSMHDTGFLTALFPELNGIECLVIRDFYHRYTVDEHTLVTIQSLFGLRGAEDRPRRSYAELLSEMEQPAVLAFALLFHDSGKADPHAGHVDGSLVLVARAMERIGMPAAERAEVEFLIRAHLELSAAMHGRDVHDPATAEELAHRIGTVERLKALTLLTWADISAVNPGAMTPWRAEQLWQVYLVVYNELTRELESERIEPSPAESPEQREFLEGLPTRYLRTHEPGEVQEHLRLDARRRTRGVAAELKRLAAAWRLTVVAPDRPALFASLAGTLSGFGMNILQAEAFANRRGVIVDTFTFADPHRNLDLNPSEVERLRATVERVVLGKVDVKELLRNRPKPPSRKTRVAPSLSFDDEASRTATLIQIVAEDRPGLLYDLASALSAQGCNIEVVLIATEAQKAIDVFYVTRDGGKLPAPVRAALEKTLGGVIRGQAT